MTIDLLKQLGFGLYLANGRIYHKEGFPYFFYLGYSYTLSGWYGWHYVFGTEWNEPADFFDVLEAFTLDEQMLILFHLDLC